MNTIDMRGESGQMAVELAMLIPVVIVVALVVYNLARYVNLCAVFDRVASDVVISQGVSPTGAQRDVVAVSAVEHALSEAMQAHGPCMVEVSAERMDRPSGGALMRIGNSLTKFTCTLHFRPWPASFVLAGVPYNAPLALSHSKSLVVDRYRSGVVM